MLSFKPAFSLSSLTLIKRLFSSSSLATIRATSSAYLRLLIFISAIFDSSNSAFHMMYSTRKLNKQGDNIQPCHTLLSILNQTIVPCPVPTFSSWPTYRFLRRKVRWFGTPISLRIFHSLLWSTVKDFSNEAKSDVFCNSLALTMIQWMLAIWSLLLLRLWNQPVHLEVLGWSPGNGLPWCLRQ